MKPCSQQFDKTHQKKSFHRCLHQYPAKMRGVVVVVLVGWGRGAGLGILKHSTSKKKRAAKLRRPINWLIVVKSGFCAATCNLGFGIEQASKVFWQVCILLWAGTHAEGEHYMLDLSVNAGPLQQLGQLTFTDRAALVTFCFTEDIK